MVAHHDEESVEMLAKQRGAALAIVVLPPLAQRWCLTAATAARTAILVGPSARRINLSATNKAHWYSLGAEAPAKPGIETEPPRHAKPSTLSSAGTPKEQTYPPRLRSRKIRDKACFNLNACRRSSRQIA